VGKIEEIHALIYGADQSTFTSVTVGCNIPPPGQLNAGNGYTAQAGWDACTGLGTPNGKALLAVLEKILFTRGKLHGA
jgi:kumamolisin